MEDAFSPAADSADLRDYHIAGDAGRPSNEVKSSDFAARRTFAIISHPDAGSQTAKAPAHRWC